MKTVATILLVLFFLHPPAKAQKNLTKEEIYDNWVSHSNKDKINKDSIRVVNYDSIANSRIHTLTDSLNNAGIDSIIVYSIAHPGSNYRLSEGCSMGIIPVYTYLIWEKKYNKF